MTCMSMLKTTTPSPYKSSPRDAPKNARPASRTRAANDFLSGNDHRLVDAVLLGDQDLDVLCIGGGHVLSHVVRPHRQLAGGAGDEDGALNSAGAPKNHERVPPPARPAAIVGDNL